MLTSQVIHPGARFYQDILDFYFVCFFLAQLLWCGSCQFQSFWRNVKKTGPYGSNDSGMAFEKLVVGVTFVISVTFSLDVGSFRSKKSTCFQHLGWSTSQTSGKKSHACGSPSNLPWTPMIYDKDDGKCHMFGSSISSMVSDEGIIKFCHLDVFFFKNFCRKALLQDLPFAWRIQAHLPRCTAHPATTRASGTLDRGVWPLALVVCCHFSLQAGKLKPQVAGKCFLDLEEGSQFENMSNLPNQNFEDTFLGTYKNIHTHVFFVGLFLRMPSALALLFENLKLDSTNFVWCRAPVGPPKKNGSHHGFLTDLPWLYIGKNWLQTESKIDIATSWEWAIMMLGGLQKMDLFFCGFKVFSLVIEDIKIMIETWRFC